uniref:Globin family profile domain-containing protein n=1 Tax=Romanomermis culicivorax TaxID=13658 RepID=A0A915JFW1_ROMCU
MVSPLTQFQKNLLREAWQRISKKGTSSIGTQIVRRMFNADQSLKRVFHHVTVIEGVFSFGLAPNQASQHHSEMFTDILSEAIENLDDLSVIIPKLNEYGARHAPYRGYGFKAEFWVTPNFYSIFS